MTVGNRKDIHVLIVEDSEVDAELLCHGLDEAAAGVRTEVETSVQAAVERLEGNPGKLRPDIVLLDLALGAHSGFDLLDRLAASGGRRNIPVIVLTGSQDQADVDHAKRAGAATYYVKPRDLDGFLELGRELKEFWIDRIRPSR